MATVMTITEFLVMDSSGNEIEADAHGDNIAFSCPACEHPVLSSTLDDQPGSDEEHPAECKGCGEQYFLSIRYQSKKLYVLALSEMPD